MKRIIFVLLVGIAVFLHTACSRSTINVNYDDNHVIGEHSSTQTAAIDHEQGNNIKVFPNGRTRLEYIEDLEYLYEVLTSNFPLINALNRRDIDLMLRFDRIPRS